MPVRSRSVREREVSDVAKKKKMLTEEAVRILLLKKPGEDEWVPDFTADSAEGAFYGLQVLINEFCSLTGISVERAVALLAARMLHQE